MLCVLLSVGRGDSARRAGGQPAAAIQPLPVSGVGKGDGATVRRLEAELGGRAVVVAVRLSNLPAGVFALLTGSRHGIGDSLVRHPAIQAVGFTGSRSGGLALMAAAAARPQPIPVYALSLIHI